ncbi:MAG: hypothetical protein R2788_11125 [Saprospiraceae bacterium]
MKKNGVAYYDVVPDFSKSGQLHRKSELTGPIRKNQTFPSYSFQFTQRWPASSPDKWVASSIKVWKPGSYNSTKGKKMAAIFSKTHRKTGFKDRQLKSTKERICMSSLKRSCQRF